MQFTVHYDTKTFHKAFFKKILYISDDFFPSLIRSAVFTELWRALLNFILNVLCLPVFTGGQSFSMGYGSPISRSDSFALQSLTVHLQITESASQMVNKRDTLCFEEIDP